MHHWECDYQLPDYIADEQILDRLRDAIHKHLVGEFRTALLELELNLTDLGFEVVDELISDALDDGETYY